MTEIEVRGLTKKFGRMTAVRMCPSRRLRGR